MNPKIITPLDVTPMIPLDKLWNHLRITPDDGSPPSHPDDELIQDKLAAAREWVEGYTGLALTPRTYELALDEFPEGEIQLPWSPIVSVTSITYVDGDGVTQTVDPDAYVLDTYQRPGWIVPAVDATWPATKAVINAVIVRYVAGYNLITDAVQTNPLPRSLKAAVLLLLGDLYENREDSSEARLAQIPVGVKSLCDFVGIRKGMA